MKKIFFIILLPILLCFSQAFTAEIVTIKDDNLSKKLQNILSGLTKGKDDSFDELSKAVGEMLFAGKEDSAKNISSLARQHQEYLRFFGPFVEAKQLGGIKLGDDLMTISYIWKMKEAATIWYFNFYKSESDWKLVSFAAEPMTSFLDRPEKIMKLGTNIFVDASVGLNGQQEKTIP